MTSGSRLRRLRLEQRLTQTELGGEELSSSYVSLIERGRREPALPTLEILARRLGVSTRYLEHGVERPDAGEVTRSERVVRTVQWTFPEVHEQLLAGIIAAVHEWRISPPGKSADEALLERLRSRLDGLEERVTTFELRSLLR